MEFKSSSQKDARRDREQRIWALRIQGYTQQAIGAELGIHQPVVSHVLKRVNARVLEKIMTEIGERKAEQVAQLEYIVHQSMQAWEASKQAAKAVQKRVLSAPPPRPRPGADVLNGQAPDLTPQVTEQVTTNVQDKDGDPRYLATAMHALGDIRKILGLDAQPTMSKSEADSLWAQMQREAEKLAGTHDLDVAEVLAEAERIARGFSIE